MGGRGPALPGFAGTCAMADVEAANPTRRPNTHRSVIALVLLQKLHHGSGAGLRISVCGAIASGDH
jgi:hypothetical protein